MSFLPSQPYTRTILRPISVPTQSSGAFERKHQPVQTSSRSITTTWTATVHSLLGTPDRQVSSLWLPDKFDEDPSQIPNDPIQNKHYDAASAKPSQEPGVYRMYQRMDEQSPKSLAEVAPPRIVVKRYLPTPSPQANARGKPALTLLMLTGMGLPKEVFEPMIDIIVAKQHDAGYRVAEIWSVDMPLCGQTALSNPRGYLYANEKDIARDLMLFVTAYLPIHPTQDLPAVLVPRSFSGNERQPVRHDLHVVSHSLGAQCAMLIAAHAPQLFASLTVFDPAMIPDGKIRQAFVKMPKDILCLGVPFAHRNRAEFKAEVARNRRTRSWDERIAQIYVDHAAVEVDQGTLLLTGHPRLEWALYYDQETPTQCFDRLVDIRTPLHAVMPSKPFAVPPKLLENQFSQFPQKTRLTWVPDSTHQLPFEHVELCAEKVVGWLKEFGGDVSANL